MAIDGVMLSGSSAKPNADDCLQRLKNHITKEKKELGNKLLKSVDKYGDAATNMVSSLINIGCDQREVAMDLSVLTLYDLVILIDDSTSMGSTRNVETLKKTLEQICQIYSLANPTDGIKSIRFINHHKGKGKVKKENVDEVVSRCSHVGVTRIGTELHRKVLIPFVLGSKEKMITMTKPLLVMVITDGTVEGERMGLLEDVIISCHATLKKRDQGEEAVAYQFIRIGDDPEAIKLLRDLDDHQKLGRYIDCLPEDIHLEDISEPKKWDEIKWNVMAKIMIGAMVPHWDDFDKQLELEGLQLIKGDYTDNSQDADDDDDEDD
jgi:hypothetical protein